MMRGSSKEPTTKDIGPDHYLLVHRTPDALDALRDDNVRIVNELDGFTDWMHRRFGYFTCDGCKRAPKCLFTFDPYNTDGDCLDDK